MEQHHDESAAKEPHNKMQILKSDICIAAVTFLSVFALFSIISITSASHDAIHFLIDHERILNVIISLFFATVLTACILSFRYFKRQTKLMNDLTIAKKELEAGGKLKLQQNKLAAIGELSGGLAHEINNSLVPAIGMSEILKRRLKKDSPDLIPFIDTIYDSSMHARKIVQNVLAFARSQDIQSDIHDWDDVLKSSLKLCKDVITDQNIEIKVIEPNPTEKFHIKVNKTAVSQIFVNLVKNATDAMPGGGAVEINFQKEEIEGDLAIQYELAECDHLIVQVRDTGTGIEENMLEKIFDPFFTTKDVDQGTGLGLATVYGTMRSLAGNISVSSQIGVGTTFTLYFPITDPVLFQLSQDSAAIVSKEQKHA